jgi:hypothetical protein
MSRSTLYAILCGRIDLPGYEGIIRTLKGAGLVAERAHMLTWIGPVLCTPGTEFIVTADRSLEVK